MGSECTVDLYNEAKEKYSGPVHVDSLPELIVTLNLSLSPTRQGQNWPREDLEKARGLSK